MDNNLKIKQLNEDLLKEGLKMKEHMKYKFMANQKEREHDKNVLTQVIEILTENVGGIKKNDTNIN